MDIVTEYLFGKFIIEHRNRFIIVDVVLGEVMPHFDLGVILDEVVGVDEEGGTIDGFTIIDEVTAVGGISTNGHPG